MRRLASLTVVGVLVLGGCGGGSPEAGDSVGGSEDPCALVTSAMIQEAFGGSSSEGEPGQARNCSFEIDGGTSPSVDVYHYGPAEAWDGVRQGFDENRGGTTDIPGLGVIAFHPNDVGPAELVVSAGDIIFSVITGAFGGTGSASEAGLVALAGAIAEAQE